MGMDMTIRGANILALIGLALILTACTDPYDESTVDASNIETAEQIAARLESGDREIFLRWASRMSTDERFPGETRPARVRDALVNQRRYEDLAEDQARAQKAADARFRQTYEFISSLVDTELLSYHLEPGPSARDDGQWHFRFRVTNKTGGVLVGLKGQILLEDPFGEEIGIFGLRMDAEIPAGRTREEVITFPYDDSNPTDRVLRGTRSLRSEWFYDALALRDGRVVSESNIDRVNLAHFTEVVEESIRVDCPPGQIPDPAFAGACNIPEAVEANRQHDRN